MKWPTAKLGDHCDLVAGFAFKSERFSATPTDVFLVKGSNVAHRAIDWNAGPWWPADEVRGLEKFRLSAGDVVLAMDRPVVQGKLKIASLPASAPPSYLVQRVARIRGTKTLDGAFVRHLLASPAFQAHIEAITTGANIPHISGGDIQDFAFPLPDLPTQRRIAEILSAYDDLIENNSRRMSLLEESAHLLYREWFVRLRFPGHEGVEVVDGLPEGWTRQTVKDCLQILGGGTPSRKESRFWEGGSINWYSPSDLTRSGTAFMESSSEQITEAGLSESSARLFPAGSVMLTSRATIGVVAINTTEACTNQGFIVLRPTPHLSQFWLYCWALANKDTFDSLATGSTFREISKGTLLRIEVEVPTLEIAQEFSRLVEPTFGLLLNLQRQNKRLAEIRDLLLPRLMDGSLPV
jgi:type I restriction enzyme S subunit